MRWGWLRLRPISKPKFQGYVSSTAPKFGPKPSTKLGLRLHLNLGEQRMCITLLQSKSLLLPVLKPTLLLKRQRQVKIVPPMLLLLLTSLLRRPSILGCQKKRKPLTKKYPRM